MANQEISLKISADVASLNTALNSAAKNLDAWSKNAMGGVTSLAQSFVTLGTRVAVATAPLTALVAGLTAITVKTANAGDELLSMSQKVGVGIEELSALQYAAKLSDTEISDLSTGLRFLSRNITETAAGTGEAKDAFSALGIKVKDSNENIKPTGNLLMELADKFSNMEDGAGKTALAMRIFGKSGAELIPLLNKGAAGIKELEAEARKLGVTFTQGAAVSANKFNDNLKKLEERITGLIYLIGNPLIKSTNKFFRIIEGKETSEGLHKLQALQNNLSYIDTQLKTMSGRKLNADELIKVEDFKKKKEEIQKAMSILSPTVADAHKLVTPEKKVLQKAPVIIDTEKQKALEAKQQKEIEAFLKKSEEETKRSLEKLTSFKEKQADENFNIEKKMHDEMWGITQEFNKKMIDADKAGVIDRTGIYHWFRLQVGEIRQKEMKDELNEKEKQETFIQGIIHSRLAVEKELYGEEWAAVQEYYQKKTEAAKYGAEAELELEKWLVAEIEAIRKKEKKPEGFLQKLQKGVDNFAKALTGSTSSTEGLGAMVDAIVGLIKTITNLPKLLNTLLKELFTNLKHFPRELVNLIKDVLVNLPNILLELIVTVITELIPVLVSEIPNMIIKMISGLFEAIKTLIFGGEIKSTIDGWTEDASNQSVTIQLDTSNAMSALKQAQEALLGAVNETDRKVAREALLSARSATILAEKQSQERQQQAQAKTFKGLFGYLGELFENIFKNAWETLKGVFTWAWDGIKGVFTWAWDGLRGIIVGLWDFLKEIPGKIWDGIKGIGDLIFKAFTDVWEGIKNAFSGGLSGWTPLQNLGNSLLGWTGISFHDGGAIKKAHSGMYLKDDEVPIIAQFGEGILNKYKGMTAIGGEAGLNFANRYGSLSGGGSQNVIQNITHHNNFEVVVDKDGNVMKLTRTQAKNLARTLDPVFKEMKRNRELSFV